MYQPIAILLFQIAPLDSLLERAKLVRHVDNAWVEVYTRLNQKKDDDKMRQFFDEFSAATTIEQQAEVLARWQSCKS